MSIQRRNSLSGLMILLTILATVELIQVSAMKGTEDFQQFAGLNTSGKSDKPTNEVDAGYSQRSKRYALHGSRFISSNLSYNIFSYPSETTLSKDDIDTEIARAFDVWSQCTNLVFTRKQSGGVDIAIRFASKREGDGRGGTLGVGYFPSFGSDVYFDGAEVWTNATNYGTNLFQVAVHEFGHALGLMHSSVSAGVMNAFYRGYIPNFKLHPDDVTGIQALYGKKNCQSLLPILCTDPKVDTIFNSADGQTYIFKGNFYYKLQGFRLEYKYPKLISEGWPGLPGNIDAAFTDKKGRTFFFKDSMYWRYRGDKIDGQYPKHIRKGFLKVPTNMNTVLHLPEESRLYIFKGIFYQIMNTDTMKTSSPIHIKSLGLPPNLDAAFLHSNGYIYFFKDDKYYRSGDLINGVDNDTPPFPRLTREWFFEC